MDGRDSGGPGQNFMLRGLSAGKITQKCRDIHSSINDYTHNGLLNNLTLRICGFRAV